MDTEGSLPGGKRPGHEADCSPPSRAYAKNSGATPSRHSAGVPAIMTEVYRYFPQFLQENLGIGTQLGYEYFLSNLSQVNIHLLSHHSLLYED